MSANDFRSILLRWFKGESDQSLLTLFTFAECAGVVSEAIAFLKKKANSKPDGKIWFGMDRLAPDDCIAFWKALTRGDFAAMEAVSRSATPKRSASEDDPEHIFGAMIDPFLVLGHAQALMTFYEGLISRKKSGALSVLETLAVSLAQYEEWDHALAILERAFADGASPHINLATEGLLWKFAYLQRRVRDVLPRLSAIPMHRELSHAAEGRSWRLLTYQIRIGEAGARARPIAPGQQPFGYTEAVAMEIAALERAGSHSDRAAELRVVLKPREMTLVAPQRGISVDFADLPHAIVAAQARLIAREKNYAEAARFAAAQPAQVGLEFRADMMINAFIDENDWRGAATLAERHDVRTRPTPPGFDDGSRFEHQFLQEVLAVAAARNGAFDAARLHAEEYRRALLADPDLDRDGRDEDLIGLWPLTVIAGVQEGVLPTKCLSLFLTSFRDVHNF